MLHHGLYEQVINNALTGELAEIPEARKSVAPIDKAEASKVLAQYLADVVQKGLDKIVVDDKAKYTDWSTRDDIKANLQVDLILLLDDFDYPPVTIDDVYKEVLEQAENFKKYYMNNLKGSIAGVSRGKIRKFRPK